MRQKKKFELTLAPVNVEQKRNTYSTRMHSSRMRTASVAPEQVPPPPARSPSTSPLGEGLDQIPLNFPLGCGPGPDQPQLPPWVWAWTRSPSASSLGVGLETHPPTARSP